MGARRFWGVSGAILALLAGVTGCEDRPRLFAAAGPGDGQGPLVSVTTPLEFDHVRVISPGFPIDVHATDPDGIDSIWVDLSPNINTLQAAGGDGAQSKSVGYTVAIVDSTGLSGDTLRILVRARDLLGDTSAVFVRQVVIQ